MLRPVSSCGTANRIQHFIGSSVIIGGLLNSLSNRFAEHFCHRTKFRHGTVVFSFCFFLTNVNQFSQKQNNCSQKKNTAINSVDYDLGDLLKTLFAVPVGVHVSGKLRFCGTSSDTERAESLVHTHLAAPNDIVTYIHENDGKFHGIKK
jgi:hypothetical protein